MNGKKLILGTVQFGLDYGINNKKGKISESDAFEILDIAQTSEIVYLDTAAAYGGAEEIIGRYILRNPNHNFKIITKLKVQSDHNWENSIRSSLAKLNVDQVDTLLFHSYSDYSQSLKSLEEIIDKGKRYFKRIGVSIYTNKELEIVASDTRIKVVQTPFNLLDNDLQRGELLRHCKINGIEVHTRSAFLQGLFFKEDIPKYLMRLKPYLDVLKGLAREVPLGNLAINYSLSKNYIDGVLVGVDDSDQFKQNLLWANSTVDNNIFEEIDKISVIEPEILNPSTWKI